jgi:hypothetical protein
MEDSVAEEGVSKICIRGESQETLQHRKECRNPAIEVRGRKPAK